ncbi:MAG: formate dehydrogenase accessory protein FdhE [Desulfomonilaceae bacterium]|jgi:FdhE protein|nr:formate dehydrogenase accessory protein FdhE [Desulfomonilaceae bacterium]
MTEPTTRTQAYERIDGCIGGMMEQIPQLSNIFDAFRGVLAEGAAVKAALAAVDFTNLEINPERYAQGVPLLTKDRFAVEGKSFQDAAGRLLPLMEKSFPSIRDQLRVVNEMIHESSIQCEALAMAVISGNEEEIRKTVGTRDVDPGALRFAVGLIMKPFAENAAESLPPLPEGMEWHQGYCPVCGSWPELSVLEGKEGRRWLRCSFCGHEWRFMRIQCPFCGNTDQDKLEVLFQEGRDHERAELCHECRKYVVAVDMRDRIEEIPHEVAALGMVYLDMLVQEKGYSPGARCPWNVIERQ